MGNYHARRQRVLLRLAALHPDEYADLMAAERSLDGLTLERDYRRVAKCGTRSGYARHHRRGEKPCALCREAENAYQRDYHHRRARW